MNEIQICEQRKAKFTYKISSSQMSCQTRTSELTCQVLWEELLRMLPLLSTVNSDILDVSEEAGQLYLPSSLLPPPFSGSQVGKHNSN